MMQIASKPSSMLFIFVYFLHLIILSSILFFRLMYNLKSKKNVYYSHQKDKKEFFLKKSF